MKFDRRKLIEIIEAREDQAQREHDARHDKAAKEWDKHVESWRAKQAPRLAAELAELAARVEDDGELISASEIHALDRYAFSGVPSKRTSAGYVGPIHEKPELVPYRGGKLLGLHRLLIASTDDAVTSTLLKECGFSPAEFAKAAC